MRMIVKYMMGIILGERPPGTERGSSAEESRGGLESSRRPARVEKKERGRKEEAERAHS